MWSVEEIVEKDLRNRQILSLSLKKHTLRFAVDGSKTVTSPWIMK